MSDPRLIPVPVMNGMPLLSFKTDGPVCRRHPRNDCECWVSFADTQGVRFTEPTTEQETQ